MDIKLNYLEKGCGEPLILLHGNGENHDYFIHQIDFFSKEYRVIAIDTRGHGESPRGCAPFTIRQFADDLYDFMNEHQIDKANILGFSDGGNIALIFALKHQDRISKLILDGANLNMWGVKCSFQIQIIFGYWCCSIFARWNDKSRKDAELLRLMVNDPNIKTKELSAIVVKTLVVAGTNDMIKRSHTKLIHKKLEGSELAIIKGDHFIANKNPEVFNTVIENFLKS